MVDLLAQRIQLKKKTQKTTYEKFVTLIELTNMKMLTKMNDET